ncbi:hypothetical protein JOL62DRAFT_582286 [Phyllosticta paracitricarpa]|uniref:Uncharacterized protein n=1 Tax=Phyllosticta paracitricarpa TaxID=2016321 RepID=A0ABR1N262_9PEZI
MGRYLSIPIQSTPIHPNPASTISTSKTHLFHHHSPPLPILPTSTLTLLPTEHSFPPTITAALIFAQHARPFQTLPMLFPPLLLLSSYINVGGFKKDAAGMSAAWSGVYAVLAMRRKQKMYAKFGARGILRGVTVGLCAVNVVGGGLAYVFGKREEQEGEGNGGSK